MSQGPQFFLLSMEGQIKQGLPRAPMTLLNAFLVFDFNLGQGTAGHSMHCR